MTLMNEHEGFYVTVRNDAGRHAFLLGPFSSHAEALEHVDRGRRLAEQVDPRAVFYAFGTARVTAEVLPAARFGREQT